MNKDIEKLQIQIDLLKKELKDLQKSFDDATKFQNDFRGKQIFKRAVQFTAKVYNAAGTVVIN